MNETEATFHTQAEFDELERKRLELKLSLAQRERDAQEQFAQQSTVEQKMLASGRYGRL